MRTRAFFSLALFALLSAACGSSPPETLPLFTQPKAAPRKEAVSRGVIGDPRTKVFHRPDCPKVKDIDPKIRQFFANPYQAVNAGYSPDPYCDPMGGWK